MQIQIDKRNNNIVYTGLQFGNYYRLDLENESRKNIKLAINLVSHRLDLTGKHLFLFQSTTKTLYILEVINCIDLLTKEIIGMRFLMI